MKYFIKNSFALTLILALFALLAIPMLVSWNSLYNTITNDMQENAKRELSLLTTLFINEANTSKDRTIALLDEFAINEMRVTIIAENGTVLYDSELTEENYSSLDNHANRQEIAAAKNFGIASSIRYSKTLNDNLVYAAESIPQTLSYPAGTLRIALSSSQRLSYINNLIKDFFFVFILFLLFCIYITFSQNNRLKQAIKEMKLIVDNKGLDTNSNAVLPQKPEFIELSQSVNYMSLRLERQFKENLTQKAELEAMLNSLQAGILVLDTNNTILKINKAFQKLLPQYFKKDYLEVQGKKTIEVFNNVEFEELIQNALASEKNNIQYEISILDKTFEVNLSKLEDSSNVKLEVAILIVLHDITHMAKIIEIKRDLIANVSHELRTPLTAIQGYAETLEDLNKTFKNPIPDADRFLNIITKNARHLDNIVSDLLNLSSIENQEEIDENQSAIIKDAVDIAIAECQILIEKKNLNIVNKLEMNTILSIDKDRLAQVFRNLIENACRYAPENTSIALFSEVLELDSKKHCQIMIQDYGRGIPQGELNSVFDRFYRVEKHRADSTNSTGLGLSLCKHIIEKYKGNIHALYHAPSLIEGNAHVGATLRFILPIHTTN